MSKPIRPQFDLPPPSPWLPYLRLMRLPNVFTAMADIGMGFLFVHRVEELPQSWPMLVVLIAASSLLYTAGMVLNDVYDLEVDRQERPFRPLPSGQIPLNFAVRLGCALLLGGVLLGTAAGWLRAEENQASPWRSGIVAVVLAIAVMAYDGWLKKTPLGPVGMGLCRLLNVLLGMSVAGIAVPDSDAWLTYHPSSWLIASGLGIYITGVTWFARSEATQSSRPQLIGASIVIAGGVMLIAMLPQLPHPGKDLFGGDNIAYLLFAVLALPMLRRALLAISNPEPANVQGMVKHCILSLIMLDAGITMLTSGPLPGLLIAALLAPSLLLGRWVYST